MRVLVTGDQGYIGSVLVKKLSNLGHKVLGVDIGYFSDCSIAPVFNAYQKVKADVRNIDQSLLDQIDCVIHLAGLSNDPLGEFDPQLTYDVNHTASVRLANLAKSVGVKKFIFASSQSIYGVSDGINEIAENTDRINPVTAYAKAKHLAEIDLQKLNDDNFSVCCFRPATVFGPSPRFRSDIVFNNFMGSGFTTGKIEIKSDGSPVRPIVHIGDVVSILAASLEIEQQKIAGQAFNIGLRGGNFSVKQIADAACSAFADVQPYYTNEHTDPRSYRVCFDKLYSTFHNFDLPKVNLEIGANELLNFFKEVNFKHEQFTGPKTVRLKQLQHVFAEQK